LHRAAVFSHDRGAGGVVVGGDGALGVGGAGVGGHGTHGDRGLIQMIRMREGRGNVRGRALGDWRA
jgi:hypothetical protein